MKKDKADKIKKIMAKRGLLWSDESCDREVTFSTRENGDVGEDEYGQEDYEQAVGLRNHILAKVPDITIEIDTCDEWVMMHFKEKVYGPEINEDDPRRDR